MIGGRSLQVEGGWGEERRGEERREGGSKKCQHLIPAEVHHSFHLHVPPPLSYRSPIVSIPTGCLPPTSPPPPPAPPKVTDEQLLGRWRTNGRLSEQTSCDTPWITRRGVWGEQKRRRAGLLVTGVGANDGCCCTHGKHEAVGYEAMRMRGGR